ncbi:hypothetical protein ACVIHH_002954 [Bradyrhizobium sp. USDA 4518]
MAGLGRPGRSRRAGLRQCCRRATPRSRRPTRWNAKIGRGEIPPTLFGPCCPPTVRSCRGRCRQFGEVRSGRRPRPHRQAGNPPPPRLYRALGRRRHDLLRHADLGIGRHDGADQLRWIDLLRLSPRDQVLRTVGRLGTPAVEHRTIDRLVDARRRCRRSLLRRDADGTEKTASRSSDRAPFRTRCRNR